MIERYVLAPSTCPRVVEHDGDLYACGLADWDHAGPCAWFIPGVYLPPVLLHPLDSFNVRLDAVPWRWHARCPVCGAALSYQQAEYTTACYTLDEWRNELRWTFEPCGCVARELRNSAGCRANEAAPGSE